MIKHIALIAHDGCKERLSEWVERNKVILRKHKLYATRTTGHLLESVLDLQVVKFHSGPLGGDQQIGAKISEGEINCLIFFWDPLSALPHEHDVKALLRLATLQNIPVACNEATGNFLIASSFLNDQTEPDISHREECLCMA